METAPLGSGEDQTRGPAVMPSRSLREDVHGGDILFFYEALDSKPIVVSGGVQHLGMSYLVCSN